jgi:hypothetical protein
VEFLLWGSAAALVAKRGAKAEIARELADRLERVRAAIGERDEVQQAMSLLEATLEASSDAVLVLGGLGFLGLGLPETIPEWGGDLQQALTAVPTGIWWTALYPGLALFVLVLGLSFLGEGLESWLSGGAGQHSGS